MSVLVGELVGEITLDRSKFDSGAAASEKRFASLAKAATVGAAVIAAALIGAGAAAYKLWESYDAGADAMRLATGKTGEAFEALEKIFQDVAKKVPDDLETVGRAVGEIDTRLGLTGKAAEAAALQYLNLARVTGLDVVEAIKVGTRTMETWNVAAEDQADINDLLYRTTQNTGISYQQLNKDLVANAATFQHLGISVEEAAAMLGGWEQAGVNTSVVMSGLKKAVATMTKEGVAGSDMASEFRKRLERIKESSDPVGEAIALFGAKAGPELAAEIAKGNLSIDELVAKFAGGTDTINDAAGDVQDLSEKFGILANIITVEVGSRVNPIIEELVRLIDENMPAIEAAIQTAFEAIGAAADVLVGGLTTVVDLLMSFDGIPAIIAAVTGAFLLFGAIVMAHPVIAVLAGIVIAVGALKLAWDEDFMGMRTTLEEVWAGLEPVFRDLEAIVGEIQGYLQPMIDFWVRTFQRAIDFVTEVVGLIKALFDGDLQGVLDSLGRMVEIVVDQVKDHFQSVVDFIAGIVPRLLGLAADIGSGLFNGIVDGISGLGARLGDIIAEAIRGVVRFVVNGVNAIIDAWNSLEFKIPPFSLDVPDLRIGQEGIFEVVLGGGKWDLFSGTDDLIPNLGRIKMPKLARGTDFWQGGWAMLGEHGPELARLPRGAQVFPANETRDILRGRGDGSGGPLIGQQVINGVQPGDVEVETARALRRAVLGWSFGDT